MLYTVIFTITGIIVVKKGNLNIGSQKSGFSVRVNAPPKTTVPYIIYCWQKNKVFVRLNAIIPHGGCMLMWFIVKPWGAAPNPGAHCRAARPTKYILLWFSFFQRSGTAFTEMIFLTPRNNSVDRLLLAVLNATSPPWGRLYLQIAFAILNAISRFVRFNATIFIHYRCIYNVNWPGVDRNLIFQKSCWQQCIIKRIIIL